MNDADHPRDSGDDPQFEKIEPSLPRVNQDAGKQTITSAALHSSVYVVTWISLSSSVILFNKWILDTLNFRYPVLLTAWHLLFATAITQLMARTTTLLDGRKKVRMNTRMYIRTILPIGVVYSLSLICGNLTYLYLSVAFIQMLKATTPVAVLITSWLLGVSKPNLKVLFNVSFIVVGVVLASFGEIKFVMLGFVFQCAGIMFEALRLIMVQQLLNSPDSNMDPLVSLFYFAPVCMVFNGLVALAWEVPKLSMTEVHEVGLHIFLLNAMVAFALNVSVVFLIGKTSSLVLTLCGVLKDILLVAASMIIWGTVVTLLQFIGYFIALGGLVCYKVGVEQVRTHMNVAVQGWRTAWARRTLLRRISIFFIALGIVYVLVDTFAPSYTPKYDTGKVSAAYLAAKEKYSNGGSV